MSYGWAALLALGWAFAGAAAPQRETTSPSVEPTCRQLTEVADACTLIPEAARMLKPTYEKDKKTKGKDDFELLGYHVTYVPASAGFLQGTTDVFLATPRDRPNRLFIVITGTESLRDWYENAKFGRYGPVYKDGQFYVPPGHAGFRRGMLNIVRDHVINIDEYDRKPGCPSRVTKRSSRVSALTLHLCKRGTLPGPGEVETVIVGHSRGAGIGMITAAAFAGQEIKRPDGKGKAKVGRQAYWPLRLHAIIAFSPPHSVYHMSDRDAGYRVPDGIEDQWTILGRIGALDRTIAFVDERDLVPNLSTGVGRNFGHRYRIDRRGRLHYEGNVWAPDADLGEAHSSHGYCRHVLGLAEEEAAEACPKARKPMGKKHRRPARPPAR